MGPVGGLGVIGQFHPSEWDRDAIDQAFARLDCLPACCRQSRREIRPPSPQPPATTHLWHRDSDTDIPNEPGSLAHLVMWASEDPTEFRRDNAGPIVTFAPGEIVWMDNRIWWHRTPPQANHQTRWFVAVRCSGA